LSGAGGPPRGHPLLVGRAEPHGTQHSRTHARKEGHGGAPPLGASRQTVQAQSLAGGEYAALQRQQRPVGLASPLRQRKVRQHARPARRAFAEQGGGLARVLPRDHHGKQLPCVRLPLCRPTCVLPLQTRAHGAKVPATVQFHLGAELTRALHLPRALRIHVRPHLARGGRDQDRTHPLHGVVL